MNRYFIRDAAGAYWCETTTVKRQRFGYWSEFEQSKSDRVKYTYLGGRFQQFIMKTLSSVQTTMEKVEE